MTKTIVIYFIVRCIQGLFQMLYIHSLSRIVIFFFGGKTVSRILGTTRWPPLILYGVKNQCALTNITFVYRFRRSEIITTANAALCVYQARVVRRQSLKQLTYFLQST